MQRGNQYKMSAPMIRGIVYLFVIFNANSFLQSRIIKDEEIPIYRKKVERMFQHAYDSYITYAYPYDELRPLTCDGHDTWGSYSLTLIDALDMLVILGNKTEFQRVANLVINHMNFDNDINVSVFETNIRVVGGLLSAHLFAKRGGMDLEAGWPCSGPLLRMAEDVARRLLPAFDTPTGMPYGTVNLKYGVPKGETTVTCTAGVGTFIVEFGSLTKLTGDPIFEKVALRALKALWHAKSAIGLVGNHIDVSTGKWTALDAGIGGGVDSYFEYLVKGSIMFQNTELLQMFYEYLGPIEKYLKRDDWYMWAHMTKGSISLPIFTSLDCYLPGIQTLLGDIQKGLQTMHNFHQVWKQFGFLPEFYNIVKNEPQLGREGYPLRPELVESAMYLYQATKDPFLLEVGADMLESIEQETRTRCGYATVKDVNTHSLENRMESFFLAETAKYLYLLFDVDNFIHNTGNHGTVVDTPNGQCIVDTGSYVFNTEGHPIDTAALHCCSAEKKAEDLALQEFHDNLDLLALFDIKESKNNIPDIKWVIDRNENQQKEIEEFLRDLHHGKGEPISHNKQKLKSTEKGDHQQVLSTDGQVFVSVPVDKSKSSVKVTISGNQMNVDNMGSGDSVSKVTDKSGEGSNNVLSNDKTDSLRQATLSSEDPIPSKDKDSQFNRDNKNSQHNTNVNQQTVVIDMNQVSLNNKESLNQVKDILSKTEEKTQTSQAHVPTKQGGHTDTKQGGAQFNKLMEMIQSFTRDILGKSVDSSHRSLHEKLKYYSIHHQTNPELLTCKAQPFYSRFSILGEMFLEDV